MNATCPEGYEIAAYAVWEGFNAGCNCVFQKSDEYSLLDDEVCTQNQTADDCFTIENYNR